MGRWVLMVLESCKMEKNRGAPNRVAAVYLKRRGVIGGVLLLLGTVLVVLFYFDPAESGLFPPCLFHALTGWHCPGCGSARGLHQLLHGHPLVALDLNPLMVLSLPFVSYGLISRFLFLCSQRRLPSIYISAGWIWALLAIIILFWILRNIPLYPFTLLAP